MPESASPPVQRRRQVQPGKIPSARRADSLRNQIYLDLRNQIQTGLIGPDDRLVDTEMAAAQGVSRMPVREALLQLANEGYLSGTTRGFVLPRLEPQDVADIFEIRRLLEPRAAANAARDMTPLSDSLLNDALAEARQAVAANDARRLALANAAFRHTWIAALRNIRLAEALGRFADQVQVVRTRTLHEPESQRVVLRGLTRLADAFTRRDALAAFDRMTAFIADAEEHFFAALGQDPKP